MKQYNLISILYSFWFLPAYPMRNKVSFNYVRKFYFGFLICIVLLLEFKTNAQSIDYSNCQDCSSAEINLFNEVMTKYQGLKGTNPSNPSTYGLIGNHKYSGAYGLSNFAFGENWYPIRIEKQILSGKFYSFGVTDYGNESDWNIHVLPDSGFEDFIFDAIPYRSSNWYGHDDWGTTRDGKPLIEGEITPNKYRYGNPWFSNIRRESYLIGKQICMYGPFVREEAHGNHPEIHPCEQIWWKEGDDTYMVLLVADASYRFNDIGDYEDRNATTTNYTSWSRSSNQETELSIPFSVKPGQDVLYMSVQAEDNFNFYAGASYTDPAVGNKYSISYKGSTVVTVQEAADIDRYVGVSFRNVCFNKREGRLQGHLILNTAIGNGSEKEGFVALRIDKIRKQSNELPTLMAGDLTIFDLPGSGPSGGKILSDVWRKHSVYDNQFLISDIVTSDIHGKGIVHGMIDFNGNGKTDLFAIKDNKWMVLYDGEGKWKRLNSSGTPIEHLRFGDVNGDGKTDVLRVGDSKIFASYGGISQWSEVTDADGARNANFIKVSDFNGDGITDLTHAKYFRGGFGPNSQLNEIKIYVKYNCRGAWKELKIIYFTTNLADRSTPDELYQNFRFGNFNGDKITDVLHYHDNKFEVYWNGVGDPKHMYGVGNINVNDLLFVDNLISTGYTDIIHFDRNTKQWTMFLHKGKERIKTRAPRRALRYEDPSKLRFGNLDQDLTWELFTVDFAKHPVSPAEISMNEVQKAKIEPVIMPRYVPGSLKRVQSGGKSSLTIDLDLLYYAEGEESVPNIEGIKDQLTLKDLAFENVPLLLKQSAEPKIGTMRDIPMQGAAENQLQIMLKTRSTPLNLKTRSTPFNYELPGYSISGVSHNVVMTTGAEGSWSSWTKFLAVIPAPPGSPDIFATLTSPPAPPLQVETVEFELLPFYGGIDEGKVRLIEMGDVPQELNEIAYGEDNARISRIFGESEIFEINWQFELKNLTTNKVIAIPNMNSLISNGRWPKSKITFRFPQETDLLEFKAIATIRDKLGNSTLAPLEFRFSNQQIRLSSPEKQITHWMRPLENSVGDFKNLLIKANYLAEDNVLTPEEFLSIKRYPE